MLKGICIFSVIIYIVNHNFIGTIPLFSALLMGIIEILVYYKTAKFHSKLTNILQTIITSLYNSLFLLFAFQTLIGLISYINGSEMTLYSDDWERTYVHTDPVTAINANRIYNNYPLTYRTDYSTLESHILAWADLNGYHSELLANNTIHIEIIQYWTFFNDVLIQIRPCFKSKGFMSVLVQVKFRLGYRDLTTELDEYAENIYQYLASKFKSADYSFAMCQYIIY